MGKKRVPLIEQQGNQKDGWEGRDKCPKKPNLPHTATTNTSAEEKGRGL